MEPGAAVAYIKDPSLYGLMVVTEVTFRGMVYCDDALLHRCGPFQPHELDDAAKYYTGKVPDAAEELTSP